MLVGDDGIIFVADIQPHLLEGDLRSWNELKNYYGKKLGRELPGVIMLNKLDIPNGLNRQRITDALEVENGIQVFP